MPNPRSERTLKNNLDSLPNELKEFLNLDTYSLLIKGSSGTGKTTLSLTILKSLKATKNFFYISTRTSPLQLFAYYPWLSKFVKSQVNFDQQSKPENQLAHAYFEDARLDEPESLFERITNELMDIKSPIIVIDSWDAIASLMDKESRINNERVLQTWRERAKARIIFVTEGIQDSALDFMVDGVLELSNDVFGTSITRKILIKKLRGVGIEHSIYLYSLRDNVFRFFCKYNPSKYASLASNIVNTVNGTLEKENVISLKSGFTDLDLTLGGGYRKGNVIILETSKILSYSLPSLFLEKIIKEFVYKEGAIIVGSSPLLFHLNDTLIKITNQLESKVFNSKYRRATRSVNGDSSNKSNLIQMQDFIQSKDSRQGLNIMGLFDIKNAATEMKLNLATLFDIFKNQFEISFIIVEKEEDADEYMRMADIYLKFDLVCGTLVLKCILPSETIYGIDYAIDRQGIQLYKIF